MLPSPIREDNWCSNTRVKVYALLSILWVK